MAGQGDRGAQFICALALCRSADDPIPMIALGQWRGQLLRARRGDGGFGYDPIFQPDGFDISAAEMPADQKSQLSHRGLAVAQLRQQLINQPIV